MSNLPTYRSDSITASHPRVLFTSESVLSFLWLVSPSEDYQEDEEDKAGDPYNNRMPMRKEK